MTRAAAQLALLDAPPPPGSSAVIVGPYRYRLERAWEPAKARCAFIMLNPSTADARQDDPTIRRCIGFARKWGFGGLVVGNLFALRATDPRELLRAVDPVGPENDAHLLAIARTAGLVVAAWGTMAELRGRGAAVRESLEREGVELQVLGLTAEGYPRHPLYLKRELQPRAWRREA